MQGAGLELGALEWGDPSGPLVLCLHGYPDTAWTWRRVAPLLAASGRRVVAPFLRGYAPSALAPDGAYQVGALVADVVALHGELGADSRAVLIGHDWGAIAAYAVGAHRPDLFRRIVTIAVPPLPSVRAALSPRRGPGVVGTLARQARCSWYAAAQQLPVVSERLLVPIVRRLWADWSPGYDAEEDLALLAASLDDPRRRTAALRYYRAMAWPWYRRSRYRGEQAHLMDVPSVPVLYVHGRDDGCVLVELGAGATAVLAGGSHREVVEQAGHFVQLEQPEVLAELIEGFLGP